MRAISRIVMVAVFLLLPVFVTGASLEVPGGDCCSLHCCMSAQYAGRAGADELPEGWSGHHHELHAHDCILLLRDAGLRDARTVAPQPSVVQMPMVAVVEQGDDSPLTEPAVMRLPLYGGFLLPQRC